ncbi:hypothetical protein [Pseudomonas putida]|uniref:hypothetical protein n=1 Tax=Pseudomonas putida TaxID=303 RepID=UPI00300F3B97
MINDTSNGLERCKIALERLKAHIPIIEAHKNLPLYKITAGVVSVEAGFDRGYLKYSRPAHRRLIDDITAFRESHKPTAAKIDNQLDTARCTIASQKQEIAQLNAMLQNVVTQNLQLVEALRALQKLKTKTNISPIKS